MHLYFSQCQILDIHHEAVFLFPTLKKNAPYTILMHCLVCPAVESINDSTQDPNFFFNYSSEVSKQNFYQKTLKPLTFQRKTSEDHRTTIPSSILIGSLTCISRETLCNTLQKRLWVDPLQKTKTSQRLPVRKKPLKVLSRTLQQRILQKLSNTVSHEKFLLRNPLFIHSCNKRFHLGCWFVPLRVPLNGFDVETYNRFSLVKYQVHSPRLILHLATPTKQS